MDLEIDGLHHKYDAEQSLTDLKRISNSLADGKITIHIPNMLLEKNMEEAADEIVNVMENIDISLKKKKK